MENEEKIKTQQRESITSELVKALDLFEDYEKAKDMWLEEPGKFSTPYEIYTQLERAYEQLQTLGVDVSNRLRQTRLKIIRSLYDKIDSEIASSGLYLLPEADLDEKIEMSIPYLNKAINLLEEYIRKVNPNHPSLKESTYDLGK